MGFSLFTRQLLSGRLGPRSAEPELPGHSSQHHLLREAETGVAGSFSLPSHLHNCLKQLLIGEAGAWTVVHLDGAQLPGGLAEMLGLFPRSVPAWALLAPYDVLSCTIVFLWLGYYSPVINFLSLVSSRFLIKHSFFLD